MTIDKMLAEFPITVYGKLDQYNETISKARCRIFYKGPNRNGTYIRDEFAENLVKTLPYTPVKGIYDEFNEDYTDHGAERDLGRIYGIVPVENNFAWERHLDEDGVEREYACTDVLLFTGLYKEAGDIIGKAQSMELYAPTIKGDWEIIEGKKYYVFSSASFLGLQVLGDEVEPCFEGASFFSLIQRMEYALQKIEQYNLNAENSNQGGKTMPVINYRLSDSEKFMALWNILNENFTEEGNWTVDYEICNVYDDYAVVQNYADNSFERVFYEKDDETDSLHVCGKKKCYIVDVSEEEYAALKALAAINNGSYELSSEVYEKGAQFDEKVDEFTQKVTELEQKIEEQEVSISTLHTENETLVQNYEVLQAENAELQTYKLNKENAEKQEVIDKYAAQLDEEVIKNYTEKITEFTKNELEKELAFELVQSKPSIFSLQGQTGLIPQEEPTVGGLGEILEKYRK